VHRNVKKQEEPMDENDQMTRYRAAEYVLDVERDYVVAERILRINVEEGHAKSQCLFGLMHERGWGVPKDPQMALEWYHKAAAQGHADAQVSIGRCYDRGVGVPQDYRQAVAWFRKAADAGFADGQFELGQMYEIGLGCRWTLRSLSTGTVGRQSKDTPALNIDLDVRMQRA
jgi:TPR repeat protein